MARKKFSYAGAAALIAKRKASGIVHAAGFGDGMEIAGKNAIVTGAGRGIGAAIAIALAEEGANVALAARTKSEISAAAKECEKRGVKAIAVQCDVAKLSDIKKLVSKAAKSFGSIDILVNNAGIGTFEDFAKNDDELIRDTIDINLYGLVALTRHMLPHMAKHEGSGGVIVNIASGAGKTGIPGFAVYCATKFGVVGFTEALADELKDVKVYAVCPGPVDTKLYYENFKEHPRTKPEDVARVIVSTIKNPKARSGGTVDVY